MGRVKGSKGGGIRKRSTKLRKRSRGGLLSWMKINDIKQDLNDQVLSICINPILKLFGCNADLLQYLTKYASKHKLDEMYKIIYETIQELRISDNKQIYLTQNEKSKHASNFELISDESAVNICSFLSRDDIIRFKSVSRRIGILCLNEMNKYRVGICLSQNLLHSKHRKALKWTDKTTVNRYPITTTFSSIFEHQAKINNFPEKYQIPISFDKKGKCHKITRSDPIYRKSLLVIFDKRDLSILDSMNNREMEENDIFCHDTHCILRLYYFDVYNQEIILMKYLIIDDSINSTKLKEYIKDKLIENLMNSTYSMNAISDNHNIDDIMKLYPLNSRDSFRCDKIMENTTFQNKKIISLVFQVANDNNMYNWKNRKFEYQVSELKSFRYKYGMNEYSNDKKITLKWCAEKLINLKQQIKCYMVATNQSKQIIHDIMHGMDAKFANSFQFMVDTSINVNILRHYFSRFMFKNIIPADCIEIYQNTSWKILDSFKLSNLSKISLGIVPYNATNNQYYHIFQVRLYPQQQLPFPFSPTKKRKPIKIAIKIGSKGKCNADVIVEEIIKISKNPLFRHQFEEIGEEIGEELNNCYVIINDYKLCEEEEEDIPSFGGYVYHRYHEPQTYYQKYQILYHPKSTECIKYRNNKNHEITYLNILMLPNIMNNVKRHQLMIRFAWKNGLEEDMNTERIFDAFIGLPLFVGCDETDTLEDILNSNQTIETYKNDISEIYQVIHEFEIISVIPKKERSSFVVYDDLLAEDYNGFIVITLQHRDDIHVGFWMNNVVPSQHDNLYNYS